MASVTSSVDVAIIRPLAVRVRLAYSVGHVLNDLCASMWFSYLLVFLHYVVRFDNALAGYVMLLGQVVDAVCTPLVGYETDRRGCCAAYGRRKSWHLVGTISVAASFSFLFMLCIHCSATADWLQFFYYAPFVTVFQFGWASTQISHLSLIPQLTPDTHERLDLNAFRYAFTVMSNIAVYGIAWLLLNHSNSASTDDSISPDDAPHFKLLAFIVIGVGLVFSLLFHVGTPEASDAASTALLTAPTADDDRPKRRPMRWSDWLKEHQFYQVAALYMCTRLIVNVSQIYLPMYLTDSLNLQRRYIAIIPLVVYVSGFVTALLQKPLNRYAGKKITYAIGATVIIACCTAIQFLRVAHMWELYGTAVMLGAGTSIILVTSLAMTADLIGTNTESGAFVYGAMSFADKLSNGVAVVIIQHLHPCRSSVCCAACQWYYRQTLVFVPGVIAVITLVLVLTLVPQHIGRLRAPTVPVPTEVCEEETTEPVNEDEDDRTDLLVS